MKFLRQHRRELTFLWLFAIVIDFIMANDSYTHELFKHYDEAWFYMCGKAWMNGYVPYVDFADSKGPLLWLIYGLGYLMTPTSYVGVWWLSVPIYLFCFTYCYKIALLFAGRRVALLASLMMCVPYFTGFHFEMRCEDWCQPVVVYGIYRLTLAAKEPATALSRWPAFGLGAGVMACVMVKWPLAVMASTLLLAIACIAASRGGLRRYVAMAVAGMVSASVPFAVIFACYGIFGDFVREYFVYASATMGCQGFSYARDLVALFTTLRLAAVVMFVGSLLAVCRFGRRGWFVAGCALAFVLFAAYHDHSMYYQAATNSFAVFCALLAALCVRRLAGRVTRLGLAGCALALVAFMTAYAYVLHPSFVLSRRPETFYSACRLVGSVESPKILNYHHRETGVGVSAGTLPATKYWALQGGASEEMLRGQDEAVRHGLADFIVTGRWNAGLPIFSENGYWLLTDFVEYDDTLLIYARHDISVVDGVADSPSVVDRLLKRGL